MIIELPQGPALEVLIKARRQRGDIICAELPVLTTRYISDNRPSTDSEREVPHVNCNRCGSAISVRRPTGSTSVQGNVSLQGNVRIQEGRISFGEGGRIGFGPGGRIGFGPTPSNLRVQCLECGHIANYRLDEIID